MCNRTRILGWVLCTVVVPVSMILGPGAISAAAQAQPTNTAKPTAGAPISDQDLATTQDQLVQLLRTSPTLTTVVARDPSLLGDQEYVSRNNPQLAQFLAQHPEIARNPDYYLFTHIDVRGGRRDQALERAVWPEYSSQRPGTDWIDIVGPIAAAAAFACFLAALVWVIRQFIENRRWSRIFKLQSEVHGRLIERFSSTQEIATYMGTEAGRRFLEAAPIPVGFVEQEKRMPNAVARVLWPLQAGVVLVLLGAGLFFLRSAGPEMKIPMLVLGTVVLMPGIGFILSAGITWVLAGRLGLIPEGPSAAPGIDSLSHPQDRL